MGNRILKESIRINDRINTLSYFEEAVFYRLIVTVDDYGVFPANPTALAHILFPLREGIDRKTMQKALEHLCGQGLIICYHVAGQGDVLKLASWEKHQRLRNSRRLFPLPEEADEICMPVTDDCEEESAEESAEAPEENAASVPETSPEEEPGETSVIDLPLHDHTCYGVTRAEADEYMRRYPAVDVEQELRKMRGWCLSNPQRRKTRNGIRKFITNWLAREQDKGGGGQPGRSLAYNPFIRMAMEGGDKPGFCSSDPAGDWFTEGEVQ